MGSTYKGNISCPSTTTKELYIKMLSDVRQRTEHMTKIYQDLSGVVQDPSIKEALESRVFLQDKILSSLDRCFKLIGEKPVALSGRLHDVFVEDFKRELAEIQAPAAKAHLRPGQSQPTDAPTHRRVRGADRNVRCDWPLWRRCPAGELPRGQARFRRAHPSPDPADH